jgi:hypothetical protein
MACTEFYDVLIHNGRPYQILVDPDSFATAAAAAHVDPEVLKRKVLDECIARMEARDGDA